MLHHDATLLAIRVENEKVPQGPSWLTGLFLGFLFPFGSFFFRFGWGGERGRGFELFHHFAELKNKADILYRLSLKIKFFAISIYFVIAVILFMFSHDLISIFFNEKYELLHDVIRVIIVASIFQIYIIINGGIWSAIGDMKLNTQFFTVYSIAYIIFMVLILVKYEFIMFPYAILAVSIFGTVYSEILLRKRLLS